MTLDNFVLWKFKTIEGILKNYKSSDVYVTKYVDVFTVFKINYDITNMTATIVSETKAFKDITCKMTELVDNLKKLGYYSMKEPNQCHSNALIPWTGNL